MFSVNRFSILLLLAFTVPSRASTIDIHNTDSLSETIDFASKLPQPATILLHAGTYHLAAPLLLTADNNNLTIRAVPNETAPVILSGSREIPLHFIPYKNNIMQAQVPDDIKSIDQLFVNDAPQILARYPNYDPAITIFHGYAADAISPARVATWSDPVGGYIHAMHKSLWGSQDYIITAKKSDNSLTTEGGYQNNRPGAMHKDYRFVENIFEELDAPKEFFFNPKTHTLYYYPSKDLDLAKAQFEINNLQTLIEIKGDSLDKPAAFITLSNLTLTHTNRTFMQTKEPILRTDWCLARTAALLLTSTENITIQNCDLHDLGGNAIFLNAYNKNTTIDACHIHNTGASAILVIGDTAAVRSPLFNYNAKPPEKIDLTPGPLTQNFPTHCTISDCLLHDIGQTEKQATAVGIDIASHITVSHCSIYNTPRAGINIGDGCFGGHLIDSCDVFDTVLETGDHGSFNSWGRDRFWSPQRPLINQRVADNPAMPLLDVTEPNTIQNSRWRCDHGWDIDLDDGSSNYIIQNNLCLSGGLKLREGYNRTVQNNILVNSTFFAHVWLNNSHDIFSRNIVFRPYKPTGMPKEGDQWGAKVDENTFTTQAALTASQKFGVDQHSTVAPYDLKNLPTDFGVTDPALRKLARTPQIPTAPNTDDAANPKDQTVTWLGAKIKSITTDAEVSAAGLSEKSGVLLLEVPKDSPAAKLGLQKMDVILKANGSPIHTPEDLTRLTPGNFLLSRNQSEMRIP